MITRIELNEIPGRANWHNNIAEADVRDFLDSDWPVAEVKCDKYKSAHSACVAYRYVAKNMNADVIVTERGGRLFLMRK